MIIGLDHIAIIVSSEATVCFYQNLGFVETYRKVRDTDTIVLLKHNDLDTLLELFIDPNHPIRQTEPEANGLRHLALKVDNIERTLTDINTATDQVLFDWQGSRFCFVYDPDGLPVELHE